MSNERYKFRAWEPMNKVMHYMDFLLVERDGDSYASRGGQNPVRYRSMNLDAIEVMQWTGLLDKNGKEIYEGDILKLEYDWGEDELTQVYYKDGMLLVDADFGECDTMPLGYAINDFEAGSVKYSVAGNIHENPELLK